jgi:hypothetical protein
MDRAPPAAPYVDRPLVDVCYFRSGGRLYRVRDDDSIEEVTGRHLVELELLMAPWYVVGSGRAA